MANLRALIAVGVPVVSAIFGLLWFFSRKKQPSPKPNAEPPDKGSGDSWMSNDNMTKVRAQKAPHSGASDSVHCTDGSSSFPSDSHRHRVENKGDNLLTINNGSCVPQTLASGAGDSTESNVVSEVIQEEVIQPVFSEVPESDRTVRIQNEKLVREWADEIQTKVEEDIIVPTDMSEKHNSPLISSPAITHTAEVPVSSAETTDHNHITLCRESRLSSEKEILENSNSLLHINDVGNGKVMINNLDEQTDETDAEPIVENHKMMNEEDKTKNTSDLSESDENVQQSQSTENVQNRLTGADIADRKFKDRTVQNSVSNDNNNVIDLTNDDSVIDLTGDDCLKLKSESGPQNQSGPSDCKESAVVTSPETCNQSPVHQELNNLSDTSSNCDNLSEASNDSGKGGGVLENTGLSSAESHIYEFNIPSDMCGLFIGTRGKTIKSISQQSGTKIRLQNNPYIRDFQICVIEGPQSAIDKACKLIKKRFPTIQFPGAEQTLPPHPVIMPEIMQLSLPEGVSVDIVVSSIVDAGRIFVQQPTHPTFPSLDRLNTFMTQCYMQEGAVPDIPRPIETGVICAAPMLNGWYRAQIMASHEEMGECDIKYVDYGGYSRISSTLLKQIRSDFMTLPFEAVECYMANITPLENEQYFSTEAAVVLEELTQGKLLQAQVVGHADDGIPYVHVYQICSANSIIQVNREMVNRRVVRWIEEM